MSKPEKKINGRDDTNNWSPINIYIDEKIRSLNWRETSQEEETLSQFLSAVHARKLLLQIIRLLQPVSIYNYLFRTLR